MQHAKELQQIKQAAHHFMPKGAFIAGGALTSAFTGQSINDVDFYFKSKEDFINAVADAYDESLWCVAASDRAITFAHRDSVVQLMHFDFFPTAEAVFDAFDYTAVMGAYDTDQKDFVFHEDFFKHNSQRFLRFHSGTRYPYGSLMRVLKYQDRGYKIGKSDLLRIGLACQKVELNSWDDLAKAIGGQYGEKAAIETDKEFTIDNALDLFKDTEITTPDAAKIMPDNAYDLLKSVGIDHEEWKDEEKPFGPKSYWDRWEPV
jgi:hypothetical protein